MDWNVRTAHAARSSIVVFGEWFVKRGIAFISEMREEKIMVKVKRRVLNIVQGSSLFLVFACKSSGPLPLDQMQAAQAR